MAGYGPQYAFIESVQDSAMMAYEATNPWYGSHVVPGGCTDARQSRIVRTSNDFRCESCGWCSPKDTRAACSANFKTKDHGAVSIERALQFFHVLDPQRAGYYFTCSEHTSKAYKTFGQVAGHIQKHHTQSEFERALMPSS